MKIRIDEIPEDGLHLSFSGDEDFLSDAVKSISISGDVKIDPHLRGDIHIFHSGEDTTFVGTVSALMHLRCSRCLGEFSLKKELMLDLKLRSGGLAEEFRQDADEQLTDVLYVEGPEFDPGEIILQEFLLEIPMKPLCREDCPGLCPRCGALKGSAECRCADESSGDPRWEALARLKRKTGQ